MQNFNFKLKDGSDYYYKIVDDYGYCLTVGNAGHWVRDDESSYIVGSVYDYNCAFWEFKESSETGVYFLELAVNKEENKDKYVGWGLSIQNQLAFET
jgi:hypothetical protein